MKRAIGLLLAVGMLLGLLAGCGPAEEGMPAPVPTPTPDETVDSTPMGTKPAADARDMVNTKLPTLVGKPRLIVVQDGEVDDKNSLIHTLLYTNDIDLEGIVQTSSMLHYSGGGNRPAKRWMGTDWMYDYLDAYAAVYSNLIVHDPDYPTPDYLRSVTAVGNIALPGDMEKETEGSNLIKERILAEDERPLYIEMGGGANTVARALLSIEETYKDTAGWDELYAHICEKVILFAFGTQDNCYADYIQPNWPSLRLVDVSGGANAYGYKWGSVKDLPDQGKERLDHQWMQANLLEGTGELMACYITWGSGTHLEGEAESDQYGTNEALLNTNGWWGSYAHRRYDFLSEGDSPAWMAVIPNGLRGLEDLSYSGWAGRFECPVNGDHRYFNCADDVGMTPWVSAIQSDFAMRAQWCGADSYEKANHLPEVTITEGIDLTASAGETVSLHATASDPDGDAVTFSWYQDPRSDTYVEWIDEFERIMEIQVTAAGDSATFTIPADAKPGETIHIILECMDAGGTNPVAFQRIILTVT